MISVPVAVETVLNTIQQLPRVPREAGLIEVKLKRKKIYEGCHRKEYIDPEKIFRVLENLKKMGHPYYQEFDNLETYEQRCKEQDNIGHRLIFGSDINESLEQGTLIRSGSNIDNDGSKMSSDDDSATDNDENSCDNENKENSYITKDPIRKNQFDHNRNTCMTNNYPEMFMDDNGRNVANNEELSFAPAEGNHPTNLLDEQDWDIKSWPALHPDGKFGLHYKRKVRLTDQQYFGQRILNQDPIFSKSAGYIFAAAAYIE